MVQDQLVDYIKAQSKLGTSRDAVRSALLGAGWQAGDVDDSFKKVDGAAAPVGAFAKPVMLSDTKPNDSSASPRQVIRMSDLVSTSSGDMKTSPKTMPGAVAIPVTKKGATEYSAAQPMAPSTKSGKTMGIVAVILILGLGGLAGYLYFENNTLSSQVASLGGQSAGVTSQVAALTAQVNALTASGTALNTAITSAASANQELATELSFYAVPPGGAATSTSVSVSGTVGATASKIYIVTTSYGTKISIQNSRDPKVIAALTPLVGVGAQLSGSYIPGTDMMTLVGVNGKAL